jgi:NAD(P)-dependent dehydrogenase (short-subunit alcohol dehydrogenase family)
MPAPPLDLTGKTILLTGATGGIGLEAALVLAGAGAQLVITGRNGERIDAALARIRAASPSTNVEALQADFASQQAVRDLAQTFLDRHERLDVLINNVGSVNPKRRLTADGIETTFAVNHLAPFLLTNLLLERIIKSAPARIVNVASAAHYRATLNLDDLYFDRGYGIMRAYARSKLANVLFTRELARRLAGTGVTVNAVHPGTVATGIWNHGAPPWARGLFKAVFAPIKRLAMTSPQQGGAAIVHLAASDELAGISGAYFEKNRPVEPSAIAGDDAVAARLWDESLRLTDTGCYPAGS